MKIAIFTQEFPPTTAGGIATWAFHLAYEFAECGHQVTVFVKERGGCDNPLFHLNQKFNLILMKGRNWHKFYEFWTFFYMRWYLKNNPGSVIIGATWELSLSALRLMKYNPIILTAAHGLEITRIDIKNLSSDRKKLIKVVNASHKVFSVSNYTKNYLAKVCGFEPKNSSVNFSGVDHTFYKPLSIDQKINIKRKYGIDNDSKIILTLARMIPRKGHDLVIKALADLINNGRNIVYLIAGAENRSWRLELNHLISRLNINNNVRFLGFVSNQDKLELYNIADCYIMTSKKSLDSGDSEGFGLTYIEANACMTPTIGSREGGIPDAVQHGVSGLLVDPDNHFEIVDAIEKVLFDSQLHSKLSKLGYERAINNFTWENIAKGLTDGING